MTLQTDPQYKLRLPPELKEKIVASSKEHNRSMNADIVARLEQSFLSQPPNETSQLALFLVALTQQFTSQGMEFKEFQKNLIETFKLIDSDDFKAEALNAINKKPTA